jgi:uncharacterized membrane protein
MPVALVEEVRKFQGLQFNEKSRLRRQIIEQEEARELNPEVTMFVETATTKLPPYAYIPGAIMMKIGALLNSNPLWLGWWARIGTLFAYLAILYFAIRKIPVYKPLLFLSALSPMALYQGSSITYDSLCIAFLFLFFAMLVAYYVQEGKITVRQLIMLFLVAVAQRLSKDGYFIMFFSLAFIPMSKFENKRAYVLGIGLMLVAAFVPPMIWNTYLNSLHLPAELPLQNDYLFDRTKNLNYHLSNPAQAVKLFVLNIWAQGNDWLNGCFGQFGYSYARLPFGAVALQILVMIFVVMMENKHSHFLMRFRLPVLGLVFLNCMAIIGIFFLTVTPVGGYYLHGLQGRYFTPLIPFFFLFLFYTPVQLIKADWMKWAVPLFATGMLLFTIDFMQNHFYGDM